MQNLPVDISKREPFVLLEKRFRFLGIPLRAAHPTRRHLITFFEISEMICMGPKSAAARSGVSAPKICCRRYGL
jgi:hypothetical protein